MKRTYIFVCLVALACTTPGKASSGVTPHSTDVPGGVLYSFRAGLLAHDVDGIWSGSSAEKGIDVNVELVFKEPSLWLGGGRVLPNAGMSINTRGDTSSVYGGLIWEFSFGGRFFTNTGIGLAIHSGKLDSGEPDRKQLGSRVLFRIPFEFGITLRGPHSFSILFDHMSNAYLARPNSGMDTLGIRYAYRF